MDDDRKRIEQELEAMVRDIDRHLLEYLIEEGIFELQPEEPEGEKRHGEHCDKDQD